MSDNVTPKFANPAPLGLACFALTTWLLDMVNAGWFSLSQANLVLAVALAFGGTTQIIAGIMEVPRGSTFGATVFLSYGAFWWSLALFMMFLHDNVPPAFLGWYLFLWGLFTVYLMVASLRLSSVLAWIFLCGCLSLFLLAAGTWMSLPLLGKVGGYVGLVSAALAFYLAAAHILNETYGRTVLPFGEIHHAAAPEEHGELDIGTVA